MSLLVIAVISKNRERSVTKQLVEQKFFFTRLGSTGGFLKKRSATLLIGLKDNSRLDQLKEIFATVGRERSALVSGGTGPVLGQETGSVEIPEGAARLTMGGTTLFVVKLEELTNY